MSKPRAGRRPKPSITRIRWACTMPSSAMPTTGPIPRPARTCSFPPPIASSGAPPKPMSTLVAPEEPRSRNTYTRAHQLFFRSIAPHKPVGIPPYSFDLHQVERHMAAFPNTDELKKQVNMPVYEPSREEEKPAGGADRQVRNEQPAKPV